MLQQILGTNTLYYDLPCPQCGSIVRSGIGFRVGAIKQLSYHLGEKLRWDGPTIRPGCRPEDGNLKTIGYFNCDNPRCDTWRDCFPDIQEALITIKNDVIMCVESVTFLPGEQSFPILEPKDAS